MSEQLQILQDNNEHSRLQSEHDALNEMLKADREAGLSDADREAYAELTNENRDGFVALAKKAAEQVVVEPRATTDGLAEREREQILEDQMRNSGNIGDYWTQQPNKQ